MATDSKTLSTAGGHSGRAATCKNCGTTEPWGPSLWCPDCGWYPALNRCIDTADGDSSSAASTAAPWEQQGPASFRDLFPLWACACLAGVLLIAGLTAALGYSLLDTARSRAMWTLAQMAAASLVLGVAHVASFFVSIQKSDRISPFDVLLKPVEIWKLSISRLPKGAWRVCLLSWALTALILAPLLIGGVNWMSIFEDGLVSEEPGPNLLQSVVATAQTGSGGGQADSLEDAIGDFVGDAEGAAGINGDEEGEEGKDGTDAEGAEGEAEEDGDEDKDEDTEEDSEQKKKDEEEKKKEEARRPLAEDCVIVGYTVSESNQLDKLVLAAAVNNRIRYVGRISADGIPSQVRRQMLTRMRQLGRSTPFVHSPLIARWLRPVMMVRVRFVKWSPNQRMIDPAFSAVLKDVH